MGHLLSNLRELLISKHNDDDTVALIARAYGNDPSLRRAKNSRPRTDLMVGGLLKNDRFHIEGLLFQAAKAYLNAFPEVVQDDFRFGTTRYIDIAFWSGDWFSGHTRTELAIEVENDWNELRGTLRDLLSFQSRRKWAVFYKPFDDFQKAAKDLEVAVKDVCAAFTADGFKESDSTLYEIVVLPEFLTGDRLLGASVLEMTFTSKHAALSPKVEFSKI